jgi:hypothetical protein
MPQYFAKIGVSNDEAQLRVIWVEPWADDYTLLPGESLEIHVHTPVGQPWFNVVAHGRHTQVYVEVPPSDLMNARIRIEVYQGTQLLQPGHNRQAAIDAGVPL